MEVTEKKVRRERAGHIELVVPVAHIWYFRSLPNKIGYLLGLPTKKLDAVIYYERYVVIQPGPMAGKKDGDGNEAVGSQVFDLLSEEEYNDIMDNYVSPENDYLDDSDPKRTTTSTTVIPISSLPRWAQRLSTTYSSVSTSTLCHTSCATVPTATLRCSVRMKL